MYYIKQRLGAHVESTGMTKGEIAEALGITMTTLKSKVNGDSEFKLSEAVKLSEILGCTVDDLRVNPFSKN